MTACYVTNVGARPDGLNDDVLILAASWEARCLGVSRLLNRYSCELAILSVYDGASDQREIHINELSATLKGVGTLEIVPAMHSNPLQNVVATSAFL